MANKLNQMNLDKKSKSTEIDGFEMPPSIEAIIEEVDATF